MKAACFSFIVILSAFCIVSTALSEEPQSSTEAYLEELHAQGLERVIIKFKDDIDTSIVDKYSGNLIRVLKIINSLVCEIPKDDIETLKQEDKIERVIIDSILAVQPGDVEIKPEYQTRLLKFKEEYLSDVRATYINGIKEAYLELGEALKQCRLDTEGYYQYYACFIGAVRECYEKITSLKSTYLIAMEGWEEKVRPMVIMSYEGDETLVEWNNLEDGMNTQAAWDTYGLDGTGIKIAIIDSGIQYDLEDLTNNYLGGYDFVDDDSDPRPPVTSEKHGTFVASIAVAEGISEMLGAAYKAGYYAIRAFHGEPGTGLISDAIAGIEWAMDPDGNPYTDDAADIINMSFGQYGESIPIYDKDLLEAACNAAYAAGIVLVAGSGNGGYSYSAWPAEFENVISVGAHGQDQTVWDDEYGASNGGVDIVAPGAKVGTMGPDTTLYWAWGTSFSTPHAVALIALQIQHARNNNIEVNNGYLWEVMKHSAQRLTGEAYDPVYQGMGKIWAAGVPEGATDIIVFGGVESGYGEETVQTGYGSIDLMSNSVWPFDYDVTFLDYLYLKDGLYPAYFITTDMEQEITLINESDVVGNTPETIENLGVTVLQEYYGHDEGTPMPGDPVNEFYPPAMVPGGYEILQNSYYIPIGAIPGLNKTILDLEFTLQGSTRLLTIRDNEAAIWCPPPEINDELVLPGE